MRFLKNSLIVASVCLLVFSSCKNDLKLNAPYKEIPNVHAIINPYEKMQMIRINKVFLGEGDANQMAKVADSINYQAGELTVTLDRYVNGVQRDACPQKGIKTIEFRDSVITTNNGTFNTTQRVYVWSEDLRELKSTNTYSVYGDYVLTIKNNKTGNVFKASASAIERVNPAQGYGPINPPYRPYDPGVTSGFINYYIQNQTANVQPIRFKPVNRGKIYELAIRHHFYSNLGSGNYSFDFVDYVFNDPKSMENIGDAQYITITFKSGDYFTTLSDLLTRKKLTSDVLSRKIIYLEYIIYASTQEYVDFIEFSKPSLSLNQNKPLYSNFENKAALGIFTFRSTCSVEKELDRSFISSIASHPKTCGFKFEDANGVVTTCR